MIFSLETLRSYLWYQFGISAERVSFHTLLVEDLHLTDDNVTAVINYLMLQADITFTVEKVQQLTDVFDLMMYVLLCSLEHNEITPEWHNPDCATQLNALIDGISFHTKNLFN